MINKVSKTLILFAGIVIYSILPSVNMDTQMNGTQSGKTVLFLWLILIMVFIMAVKSLIPRKRSGIKYSTLDILLLILALYTIVNGWLHSAPLSLRTVEFPGLILLYISLRQIRISNFSWLFMAVITGGLIQAIFGNLQLWGYFPSHHNLFKMTGSFFNPGPYAGYLASVFPVALAMYLDSNVHRSTWERVRTTDFKDRNHGDNFNESHLDRDENNHESKFKLSEIVLRLSNFYQLIIPSLISRLRFRTPKSEIERNHLKKPDDTLNLSSHILKFRYYAREYISLAALIAILLVLPATRSRAAWLAVILSSGYLFLLAYKGKIRNFLRRHLYSTWRIIVVAIFSLVITGGILVGLYDLKKDSANGRILIWKVTTNMIKDRPFFGSGLDNFKSRYMDYQANWFEEHPGSQEAMVAGDTNYAFNEFLQQASENGMIGFLLILVILALVFKSKGLVDLRYGNAGLNEFPSTDEDRKKLLERISESGTSIHDSEKLPFKVMARAGIISITVFALFSYPSEILPIKTNLVLCLASFAGSCTQKKISLCPNFTERSRKIIHGIFRFVIPVILFALIYSSFQFLNRFAIAYKKWNDAFQIYQVGAYQECLEDYENAWPLLKTNGDYLTNYGKALSMAGKHEKAIEVLMKAGRYFPNVIVYTALGDCYKEAGNMREAEKAYIHAWYMNPSRFYPKYLLAKLYDETGQNEKARTVAEELLQKEVKVTSTAIKEIREEMRNIVNEAEIKTGKTRTGRGEKLK